MLCICLMLFSEGTVNMFGSKKQYTYSVRFENWVVILNASMSFVCCGPQSKFAGKYARNVCNGVIGALVAENLKHSSTKLSC